LGTLKAALNTYQQQGKISRHETRRKVVRKKRNPMLSLAGQSNDLEFLPEPRAKGKTCSICRCPKHQQVSSPKMHKYKKPPLIVNKDMMSHHELSTALSKVSCYKTKYCPTTGIREMSSSTPSQMTGVVIHRRFFVNPNTTIRMCLECTILDQIGDAHLSFQNFLFTSECILVYIPHSKSNVVIFELEDACTEGYEFFGFPLSQTQPNAQYLSQSDQKGYGLVPAAQMGTQPNLQYLSHLDQMGYGLVPKTDQMRYGLSEAL
jgi:hypothetical protein